MILKRYDSKGVRGWWSANDMIPWELGDPLRKGRGGREDSEGVRRTAWRTGPGKKTGMPRNCIRDAKGTQKTHMAGKAGGG